MEMRILVLGNDKFASKLDSDLAEENIPHTVDNDVSEHATYDLCICDPEMATKISPSQCGGRMLVFNGVKIANSTLKNLVRLRINGFLEDHDDTSIAVDFIKRLANTKKTCERLTSKLTALCA